MSLSTLYTFASVEILVEVDNALHFISKLFIIELLSVSLKLVAESLPANSSLILGVSGNLKQLIVLFSPTSLIVYKPVQAELNS